MEHDRAHAAVLVGVVDQVVGEEQVGHVVGEAVGDSRLGEALEVSDAALHEVLHRDPRVKPLGRAAEEEVRRGEGLVDATVGVDVVPLEVGDVGVDVRRRDGDLDELRLVGGLVRDEALEDLEVGDVHVHLFGGRLQLLVQVLAERIGNVGMD